MKKLSTLFGAAILVAACGGMPAEEANLETTLRTPGLNSSVTRGVNKVIRFAEVKGDYTLEIDLSVHDPRDRVLMHGDQLELRVKNGRIEVVVDGRVLTGLNAVVGADYKVRIVATDGETGLFVDGVLTGRTQTRAAAPTVIVLEDPRHSPHKWIRNIDLFARALRADVDNWERIRQYHRLNRGKLYVRVHRAPVENEEKAQQAKRLFLGGNPNNANQVSKRDDD